MNMSRLCDGEATLTCHGLMRYHKINGVYFPTSSVIYFDTFTFITMFIPKFSMVPITTWFLLSKRKVVFPYFLLWNSLPAQLVNSNTI